LRKEEKKKKDNDRKQTYLKGNGYIKKQAKKHDSITDCGNDVTSRKDDRIAGASPNTAHDGKHCNRIKESA